MPAMDLTLVAPEPVRVAPHGRPIRVALAGCGVVGGALVELATGYNVAYSPAAPRRVLDFTTVLVRDPAKARPAGVTTGRITRDIDAFARHEVDVVVEALGGVEPAASLAYAALERGIPFVTANKAMIAVHGPALSRIARERGAALRFEAAVGGGIPVLRALRSSFRGVGIRRIRGILNGTSNYVLTRMQRDGESFDAALTDARARGYAEADATRDLDGRDAADKLAILAWLAFGVEPAAIASVTQGLLPDPHALVREAAATDRTLRLVAECERTGAGVTARVEPMPLSADSPLARVEGVTNCLIVETVDAGEYVFAGPGAGGAATASALLADVLAITDPQRG